MMGLSFGAFFALVLVLVGALAQTETSVPYEDLFPTSVPEGSISLTVSFELDEDLGAASSSSNFTMDNNENDEPFGTLFLMTPNQAAMSDLSESSDWVLTGCDPEGLQQQSVTAFCSKSMGSSSCSHVFKGAAAHTIVKMPAGCGKGPLARVHALNIHPNQNALSSRELKAKPASEPLYQLTFDYDFAAIPADNGPVYMRADASDIPGYWDAIVDSPTDPSQRRVRRRLKTKLQRRGMWDTFTGWLDELNKVQASDKQSRTFSWQDSISLFNAQVNCPGNPKFTAALSATATASTQFATAYGYYVEGTLVPPNVTSSYIYLSAEALAQAEFILKGTASVQFSSSHVTFAEFAFPGLKIPGIITVGPSLIIEGYISGGLAVDGEIAIDVQYAFPQLNFAVGKGSSVRSSPVLPKQFPPPTAFFPSLSGSVVASGNLQVHFVPSVELGISLVDGKLANAQAYVEADLVAGISLNASIPSSGPYSICATPFVGVDVSGGLRGSVLYWDGDIGPYEFYENQLNLNPKCAVFTKATKRDTDFQNRSLTSTPSDEVYKPGLRDYEVSHSTNQRRATVPGRISCPSKIS